MLVQRQEIRGNMALPPPTPPAHPAAILASRGVNLRGDVKDKVTMLRGWSAPYTEGTTLITLHGLLIFATIL